MSQPHRRNIDGLLKQVSDGQVSQMHTKQLIKLKNSLYYFGMRQSCVTPAEIARWDQLDAARTQVLTELKNRPEHVMNKAQAKAHRQQKAKGS